jgi:alkaline phosphatase D
MTPTRRELLAFLAASACGLPGEAGPASPRFPLGVACGDPTDTTAQLWTVLNGAGPLSVRVWPRADEAQAQLFDVPVGANDVALLPLTGLQPRTWYAYAFSTGDGATSDEGQFRTAPGTDALVPLTFGVTSCARQTEPLTPLTRLAQDYELDAYLTLGDSVYADGAVQLSDYRAKWRTALARRPNRLVRAATGLVATWDDHEVLNDVSADRADPAQLAAARAAFFEHQPVQPAAPNRLWRSLRFGRTAEVFVLDCRGERDHATGEYISAAQLAWLEQGLANSPATFKLVMNSVPISSYPGVFFGAFAPDRWEGWPVQREALLRFVDEHRDGVLWLTGDFHIGVAGRVALTGPGAQQVEIAAGPAGANVPNPALSYPSPPQFDFASAVNNVVVLDLDPATRAARVRFVAGDGRVLFEQTYTL